MTGPALTRFLTGAWPHEYRHVRSSGRCASDAPCGEHATALILYTFDGGRLGRTAQSRWPVARTLFPQLRPGVTPWE